MGLRRYKKTSKFINAPSYKVYYNLLRKLDVPAFAKVLSDWLNEHNGSLPKALALDGKFIKDTVGMVCLADHETGVPEAMMKAKKKSQAKNSTSKEVAYYISSIPRERYTEEQLMRFIRNHWGGVEIRNHWRKDACLLEDATRSENPNIVACLAMLRNCYLHFAEEQNIYESLPALTEAVAADPGMALPMLTGRF